MITTFRTHTNGKPTYFIEKIWASLFDENLATDEDYIKFRNYHFDLFRTEWDITKFLDAPKIQTIREDAKNQWKPGKMIHPVIKPKGRYSAGFQFAPILKCVSVQEIIIEYFKYDNTGLKLPRVWIDDKPILNEVIHENMKQLALNDGFDTIEDFFAFFNKDFTGKIIHWTNFEY